MILFSNPTQAKSYVPYNQLSRSIEWSAKRLASGNNFANPTDGTGELGVADRMRLTIVGTNAMISGMENAANYSATQDEVMNHVQDILTRLSELAASAVDPTKTTADRTALNTEFRSLNDEVNDLTGSQYNGTKLFGTATTIRVGVETSDVVNFSQVDLSALTFTTMSILSVTTASAALISLKSRATSLTQLRNIARGHYSRMQRLVSITQSYSANLQNSNDIIRDVDVARETGNFSKLQVMRSAAQSVIAQANNLTQGDLRFFQ